MFARHRRSNSLLLQSKRTLARSCLVEGDEDQFPNKFGYQLFVDYLNYLGISLMQQLNTWANTNHLFLLEFHGFVSGVPTASLGSVL